MPIFSLPSNCGIGTLGKGAYDFIRFLKASGQKYWQILPVCPPAKADSPYLSYSSRAGNPYFIDIDWLIGDGWIKKEDADRCSIKPAEFDFESAKKADNILPSTKINYKDVKLSRAMLFHNLFINFKGHEPDDYFEFCEEHSDWLHDYALFMSLLKANQYKELYDWPNTYKYRNKIALESFEKDNEEELNYHKMLQYFFYKQWRSLQEFAHKNDVKIVGDIPLYVALTSADAWVEPKIFQIDDDFTISTFSGCPPNISHDKKSTGQIWDSPVYDWEYLKKTNYKWWVNRLKSAFDLYDVIRIDHFKGFEKYYTIDAKNKDPKAGEWKKGPGYSFWSNVAKQLGYEKVCDMPVFAEDLGIYTPGLKRLVNKCKFEGMKVLQYAFNDTKDAQVYIGNKRAHNKNKYLPKNYSEHFVSYLSTHDTNTIIGYINEALPEVKQNFLNYYEEDDKIKLADIMINECMNSKANICILLIQDLLKLAQDARINTPGTVGINWMWQISPEQFKKLDSEKLLELVKNSERM